MEHAVPAAALERARERFGARAFEAAARDAAAAIAAGAGGAELHGMTAAALLAAGQPEAALASTVEACALAPAAPWAWRLHAAALAVLGRGADAVAAAERAVQLAPGDPWAHDALALARAAAGLGAGARAAALEAVRLAPRDADLQRRAGDAWLREAPESAEARYREAIALDASSAAAWDALAGALEREERGEDADEARRRAAALDPAFAERYRRQRAFLPLLQLGAALFLVVLALGLLPRLVPPRLAGTARAVAWVFAIFVPALFALGGAAAARRGRRAVAAPDPQLADAVRRL
jgi:tetratricopeptide (TPR) repeat protein